MFNTAQVHFVGGTSSRQWQGWGEQNGPPTLFESPSKSVFASVSNYFMFRLDLE